MRLTLIPHPDTPSAPGLRIEASATRPRPSALSLDYIVSGKIKDLIVPPIREFKRTDLLWQHTCFEAFVRAATGEAYYEFNFAPSTEWAAYRFTGYRAGMSPADIAAPRIAVRSADQELALTAELDLGSLIDIAPNANWQIALSAVIEASDGRKFYWALTHPPGKPDFHHSDSSICSLSP